MNNFEDFAMTLMALGFALLLFVFSGLLGVVIYQSFEPDTYNKKTINLNIGENNAKNLLNQR